MRSTRTQTLIILGLVVGLLAGVALAATFAPGDAGKVSDGVTFQSPDGMEVTITGETNVSMESMFPDSRTVDLTTESGNATFAADSSASATIHETEITGTWTNMTSVTAGATWIELNPEDKQRIETRGDVNALSITSMAVDDGTVDMYYAGSDGGTVSVQVYGLPANTELGAIDANSGELLDGVNTDSNGVATFDMPASSHNVELQTTDNDAPSLSNPDPAADATVVSEDQTLSIDVSDPQLSNGDDVDVTIDVNGSLVDSQTISSNGTVSTTVTGLSEGDHTWTVTATDTYGETTTQSYSFTVDHYDPVVEDLEPAGLLESNPSQLSANVSDADFGGDGDSLTVVFTLDGSQIDSQTISRNQSVSTSIPSSGLTGGDHSYEIEVTDDYGQTVTASETYSVPDTFYVRNESDHSDILNNSVALEITFYGDDETYTSSTSDGTVQMTGLPVNQDFIAVATPDNSNYTTRALYITSIYEQQSVYLLNTSVYSTVESRFELNDPTGQYDSQSVVALQRSIDINGTSQWQTVHSDRFGTEGVTVQLEDGVRYRTKVLTTDGTQQVVGPYRADVSETVTVKPGAPSVDIPEFSDGYGYEATISNQTVEYQFEDPDKLTSEVKVYIHEKGNKSNLLVSNSTFYDVGTVYNKFSIGANDSEKVWVVNFIITRDGNELTQSRTIQNQKQLFDPLAPGLQAAIGVALLLLLGGAFSVLNAGVGAVVVSLTGGMLWWVGLLSGPASAILIAISMFVSVVYHVASSSGP